MDGSWSDCGARVEGLLARIPYTGPGGCVKAVGALGFYWATQVEDCGGNLPVLSVLVLEYSSEMLEQWSRPTRMRAVLCLVSVVSCFKAGSGASAFTSQSGFN